MQWIQNAKQAPKMRSVQAMGAIAIVQLIASAQQYWAQNPELQSALPALWVHGITAALAVAGIVGRLIVQPGLQATSDPQTPPAP